MLIDDEGGHSGRVPHSRPSFGKGEIDRVSSLLGASRIAEGGAVRDFEARLSKYLGGETVVTASGRQALGAALLALDVAGGEVVLPTYVCSAVLDAVLFAGATPVLCDNEVGRWVASRESILDKVTPRTRAVIPVHTFGISPFDFGEWDLEIPLVVDQCQAFHAPRATRHMAIYSFYATKELTTGYGGAVFVPTTTIATALAAVLDDQSIFTPMTDIQAAIGVEQLGRIGKLRDRRRMIMDSYLSVLPESLRHSDMVASAEDRSRLTVLDLSKPFTTRESEFGDHGVTVRRGVDELLHRRLGLEDDAFPVATQCYLHTVSIPSVPSLDDREVDRVGRAVSHIWGGSR